MNDRLEVRTATPTDLDWIHGLRHRVYAEELAQHSTDASGQLRDALDGANDYLVATSGATPIGFVSLTPPWVGRYGLDKYMTREEFPLLDSDAVFEVRLLTVEAGWRGTGIASLLMYAALRWISSRGGRTIVAMGRTDLLDMYRAVGLVPTGRVVRSGAAEFEVMTASVADAHALVMSTFRSALDALMAEVTWSLDMAAVPTPDGCEHGGASFTAIGADFRTLDRRREVVAADVLDAWFSPTPRALQTLAEDPSWTARTSPPTDAGGLIQAIAHARAIPSECVTVGAGSSDLIFRAFGRLLTAQSRVLLMDPGYGEYAHVTERVVGCHVDRLQLCPEDDWRIDPGRLAGVVASGAYDLVVVVNPNNPTGRHLPADDLRTVVAAAPPATRWWIDEAYLGYIDPSESLASLATTDSRVIVCTSLSKMYALSGMRAAYLVAESSVTAELRRWTPPWPVSLPAQLAAVSALGDPDYYRERWQRTRHVRRTLAADLAGIDHSLLVDEGVLNFINLVLPIGGPSAAAFVTECRRHDVYLRDLSPLSSQYQGRTVRIAVKDSDENARIVAACSTSFDRLGR
jgi:histidinol-phosphate/aromatic aminotransferase/cobyric acid decarboxylase-like protein/GNAT superfamily N-acetyltransferase